MKLLTILLLIAHSLVGQQDIYPELAGDDLLEALVTDYKPDLLMGYGPARDSMYLKVYRDQDGYVECYYSGHEVFLPLGEDPSSFLYQNGDAFGITAEHIFPQSKGASEGNAKSDMHALVPAIRQVNESRSNYPFGEIPDEETDHWFSLMEDIGSIPNSKIDEYSERLNGGFGNPGKFEPRESVKGDVARAVFYFYTMYKEEADKADADYFEDMRETLIDWHYNDAVDETELLRTNLRANYQEGKTNPYVLDCTLVDRVFGPGESDCKPVNNSDDHINTSTGYVYPNPVDNVITISGFKINGDSIIVSTINGKLIQVIKNSLVDFIDVSEYPAGTYVLSVYKEGHNIDSKTFVKN